jgi:hypothetical protein
MDKEWVRNELSKMQHKGEYTFKLSGDYKNTILYDENDVEIGSLYDLFSSDAIQINSSQLVTKKFDNAFIKTPSEKIEKIKISEIKCQVSRFEYDSNIEINLDKLIEFILKNVSKNETQYVFKEKNSE